MKTPARDTTLLRALPCLLYLIFIGWASLQPQQEMPQDVSDKLLHVVAYAGAAALWGWAAFSRRAWWFAAPLLVGYGVGLEFAQGFTPDRTPSVADAIANSTGVIVGLAIFRLCQQSERLKRWLYLPPLI